MESKPAQNIQDTFLNTVRKDKSPITIYLVSGVKLTGKIRSFDKYSVLLENNGQEQLIFKHAISTVVSGRPGSHIELKSDSRPEGRMAGSMVSGSASTYDNNGPSVRHGAVTVLGTAMKEARLAEAAEAAVAAQTPMDDRKSSQERAILVAVEFTGERRKLSSAAKLAREAAALTDGEKDSASRSSNVGLDFEASLAEFEELARSAGAEIVATLVQHRPRPDAATLVGQGKLDEIEGAVASMGADVVLFDHDLTPSQLRNLDAKLPCRVIDRTQLILDIFARHARTREGQLQVELAQLQYQLPRLAGAARR